MVLGRLSKSRSGFAGGAAGSTWVSTRKGAQRPVLTASTTVSPGARALAVRQRVGIPNFYTAEIILQCRISFRQAYGAHALPLHRR
ncbi:hypothetical protein DB771_07430 [Burkholderia sp. AU29985]|nr:hypothetical protein EGY28_15445 [Burkholderia dolosa]PRE45020.1 hypothetical protein C6P87_22005 [Burkholderia sp. AU12872]PUA77446.1 hypothetical protein DB771_07430 [Burkholderia sp. AU29985]